MRTLALLTALTLAAACGTASAQTAPSGPAFGPASVLPWATLGEAYSQNLAVSGGAPPYVWSVADGTLPPGMALDRWSGLLSGTPDRTGAFFFTVVVTDSAGGSASRTFILLVILPPTPEVTISGLPETLDPARQPVFDVQLSSAYPRDITGSVTLAFEPNAVNPSDDPAVQFSTGGRTLNFTVPAGRTAASWASPPALQTGTVAGKITLLLQYSADGQPLTPLFAPFRTVWVNRGVPQLNSVQMVKAASGFNVVVTGFSTPREVTQAAFEFTVKQGSGTRTIQLTVELESAFSAWYKGAASTAYGSAFVYTQPFTVQGDLSAIASVSVTLSNAVGASAAVTASF